jgi:hypothetical protein
MLIGGVVAATVAPEKNNPFLSRAITATTNSRSEHDWQYVVTQCQTTLKISELIMHKRYAFGCVYWYYTGNR